MGRRVYSLLAPAVFLPRRSNLRRSGTELKFARTGTHVYKSMPVTPIRSFKVLETADRRLLATLANTVVR